MRGFFKIIAAISGVAFLLTLAASIALATRLRKDIAAPSPGQDGAALFYLVAVLPASDTERYYARAAESMQAAARKDGAVLQILSYSPGDAPGTVSRLLALAAELEPDAVVASVPQDTLTVAAVGGLVARGIPVVTLESDLPGSARAAFVGTNPYSIGVMAATAIAEAFPAGASVALVLSRDFPDGNAGSATVAAGFKYGSRDNPHIELAMTRTTGGGPSASDEIIRELLADRGDIDVAVFIGARDAEGAARALLEYDRVGSLAIIGFDDDPGLLELVHLGVVTATVARSPERSGEYAVSAAMALARGGRASAYIDPGLRLIKRGDGTK